MTIKSKYILAIFFLCAAALSFLYHAYKNRFTIDELIAPVIINIEADKAYMGNYAVVAEPDGRFFNLEIIGSSQNDLPNAVVFTEIRGEYIQELFVKCYYKENRENAIKAIDTIAAFIGNKSYYFQKSTIETWEKRETEDGILLRLPVQPYVKSAIKPWINWYGDLNFALKEIMTLLISPFSFPATFLFILLAVALLWTEIKTAFSTSCNITKKDGRRLEITMLFVLLVFAFLLRVDGLTRYSSWGDELYSSCTAANPGQPLLNAFKDPGNPPFYYLLLRFWHELFGWSEASGRMMSVVTGMFGIVLLYIFVKSVCGTKRAFFAALLLAINPTHIGYSNEIRSYSLQMILVPLVLLLFFRLLREGAYKNYISYTLAGSALVNTHYYGVLLIAFNGIYYLALNRKQLAAKNAVIFYLSNGIIALSLLPFFLITAFQEALMDGGFNTWIDRPGKRESLIFIILLLCCLLLPLVKRRSKTMQDISARSGGLFEYAVYAGSFIFITAYLVSFKRPILTGRYLFICLPFLISIITLVVFGVIRFSKLDKLIRFIFVLVIIQSLYGFTLFGSGSNDVYKEAQEYICADAAAHSLKAAELNDTGDPAYYGLEKIAPFSQGGRYDVVYINPQDSTESDRMRMLADAGLDETNVLKIRTTKGKYIWKKYLYTGASR